MIEQMIPSAVEGKNTDLQHEVVKDSIEDAKLTYQLAFNRMHNPAIWHELAGAASAEFTLVGEHAVEKNSLAKEGDYFKINIPGPGLSRGEGFDWVSVEKISTEEDETNDEESCGLTLRPTSPPDTAASEETAHFFTAAATSTFVIKRTGKTVTATYSGRNEVANTDGEKTGDNIRNGLVALGAIVGLSEVQWKLLIKGFLENEVVV